MTRFSGKVGYASSVRNNGIVTNVMTERTYSGDEIQNERYFANENSVLGKVSFQTQISILADAYALENFKDIRYVEWAGSHWLVDSVKADRPRLILSLGDKYNGPLAVTP